MKTITILSLFCVLISGHVFAQTPTFSNNTGGIGNSIPLGNSSTSRKTQWFIPPNSIGSVGTGSTITHVYFQAATTATRAYPVINIKLKTGTGGTGLTGVANGPIEPGMTLVYTATNQTLITTSGNWIQFTLNTPWAYNPNLPLIVELEHNATTGTGPSIYQTAITGTANGRQYADYNATTLSGADMIRRINFGIDVVPTCVLPLYASGNNSLAPSICSGSSLTLTTAGVSNYSWSTGNTTSSVIVVSPVVNTTYSVTATTSLNCTASAYITVTVSSGAPVLTITPTSSSICPGDSVAISASGAVTYTFHNSVVPGAYNYPTANTVYSVSGQNGCGITSASITVTVSPLPVTSIVNPTIVCASTPATLSATGATSYTWLPGNATGSIYVTSPAATTIYTVNGRSGICSGQATVQLITKATPTVIITGSSAMICEGEVVNMTLSGADSYTWLSPGLSGTNVNVTPSIPTPYDVVGTNSLGCTDAAQHVVIVWPKPNVTTVLTSSLICRGATATITASGANSYSWSTGSLTNKAVVSPTSTAAFQVTGTENTHSCSTTRTITVEVYQATVEVSQNTVVCPGNAVLLMASNANSYTWSTGSNAPFITVNPLSTTIYSVEANRSINGQNCIASNTVEVQTHPTPSVNASADRSVMCRNETVTLTASGSSSYVWTNLKTSAQFTVKATTSAPIIYSVTGTDVNGCKATAGVTVSVSDCVGLAENEGAEQKLQVFPNPSNGTFVVDAPGCTHIKIVNSLGQLVQQHDLPGNTNGITITGLAQGVYFVRANRGGQALEATVIVE